VDLVAIMTRFRLTDPCVWARLIAVSLIASAGLGCPADSSAPEVPPDRFCEHKLTELGKAIAKYRAEKGSLPPSTTGPAGFKRSWRVLIAPYLKGTHAHLVDYRSDEPWDSPHNRQELLSRVPGRFTCPLESYRVDYPFASYVMLVRASSTNAEDHGRDETLLPNDAVLIVESVECRIEHGEPRDIDLKSLFEGDSAFGVGKLNSRHPKVVKALRVDGKVIDIPKDITKEDLRKLLTGTAIGR
jgi:hypothetical protein